MRNSSNGAEKRRQFPRVRSEIGGQNAAKPVRFHVKREEVDQSVDARRFGKRTVAVGKRLTALVRRAELRGDGFVVREGHHLAKRCVILRGKFLGRQSGERGQARLLRLHRARDGAAGGKQLFEKSHAENSFQRECGERICADHIKLYPIKGGLSSGAARRSGFLRKKAGREIFF